MCVAEDFKSRGQHKFFGHSICGSHKKRTRGPLEVYAALWLRAGEDADIINEGLEKICTKGEECKEIMRDITAPIEWFYK